MEDLRKYLTELRTKQNLTLDDAHLETKISLTRLREIEAGEIANLGGHGYAKATVLSYGRLLGADEKLLCRLIDREFPIEDPIPNIFIPENNIHNKKRFIIPTNFFWVILLVILIGILSYMLYNNWGIIEDFHVKSPFTKKQTTEEKKQKPVRALPAVPTVYKQDKKSPAIPGATKLTESALHDTSDYVNSFIFMGKTSPLNVKN